MTIITASGADLSRAHLVGIGGAGMSAIARLLLSRGYAVSGSDARPSATLTALSELGAHTAVGQRAENLDLLPGGPSSIIASTAIRADNPELVEADRRGLPIVRRAEALAALMDGHRSICVAGTHGKTSTSSLLTVALDHAGADPSFAIGGEINASGTGAGEGSGDIFVAEADESDGSFLAYTPYGAIITTIEPDHLDFHGTAAAYHRAFAHFAQRIAPGGFLVAGVDDPGVRQLVASVPGSLRVIGYGRSADADNVITSIAATGTGQHAEIRIADGRIVPLELQLPGEHMIANATAALVAGVELGIDPAVMAAGLATFTGVRRRFEFRGSAHGIRVFDDYAHHPTEVAATLAAARSVAADGRVVAIFQPHLYSRTAEFADRFAQALSAADVIVVLDVYGAREDPIPGVTGRLITDRMAGADVTFEPSLEQAATTVADRLRSSDIVLTMGAGDITTLGPRLLDVLADREMGENL